MYLKNQIICKLILARKKKSNPLIIGTTKSKQVVNITYSNINYHIICKLIIAKKKTYFNVSMRINFQRNTYIQI